MEGDSCSKHQDRLAIGFYSGSCWGLNGCEECIENNKSSKINLYDLKNAKKIFKERRKKEEEDKKKTIEDDTKSIEVATIRGSHWVLFGKDKINYYKGVKVDWSMTFKDKRSYFYDSSD